MGIEVINRPIASTLLLFNYHIQMRPSNRQNNQLRDLTFEIGYGAYAEGSCLVKAGNTHVLCTASLQDRVPPFLKGKNSGWVTAEYGMLPRSTHSRINREAASGKQSGRTQEIQRLIGRSLRACMDMKALGEKQIIIDCDVIQADGGTRTAAISGGFLALYQACVRAAKEGKIISMPIKKQIAAISCGIYKGNTILDLDYLEDSDAEADANFILTDKKEIVEIQCTAEQGSFEQKYLLEMLDLACEGTHIICQKQKEIMDNLL